eukprot:763199-Hanusia_phi.AAC.5
MEQQVSGARAVYDTEMDEKRPRRLQTSTSTLLEATGSRYDRRGRGRARPGILGLTRKEKGERGSREKGRGSRGGRGSHVLVQVFVDSKDARPTMHTTVRKSSFASLAPAHLVMAHALAPCPASFVPALFFVPSLLPRSSARLTNLWRQGGYKGAFVLSRTPELSASALEEVGS